MNYEKKNSFFLKYINENTKNNSFKHSIQSILDSSKEMTNYIFRKGGYWYYFDNWNLPSSGVIRRWKVHESDDWIPKKGYTDTLSKKNSSVVLDVNNLPKEMHESKVVDVLTSEDDRYLAILGINKSNYNIYIYDTGKTRKNISVVHNISVESSFTFFSEGLIYARDDQHRRPFAVFYKAFTDEKEHCLYQETDVAFRVRVLRKVNKTYTLFESKNYDASEIYLCRNDLSINKVWSREMIYPSAVSFLSSKEKNYLAIVVNHTSRKSNLILKSLEQANKEINFDIEWSRSINRIWGISNCLVMQSFQGGDQIFGVVDFTKITGNMKNIDVHQISEENELRYYPNNYSPLYTFFTSNDGYEAKLFSLSLQSLGLNLIFTKSVINKKKVGINKLRYSKNLIWAESRDSKIKIPITIMWKNLEEEQLPNNKKSIIYVYGAYGQKEETSNLDPIIISIIEQGFVYCIVHVRGGGFMGEEWYQSGKKMNKWNSINDLIDCCEYLINQSIVDKNRLGLLSSSAGGVTAGAAFSQKPNLFKGMLLFSPLINPLKAMLNRDDPLTKTEIVEWGDPLNSEVRKYIESYSPFQNAHKCIGSRAKVLLIAGEKDIYVNNDDIVEWSNLLNSMGVKSYAYVNPVAGHGGINGNDTSLLSQVLASFLASVIDK